MHGSSTRHGSGWTARRVFVALLVLAFVLPLVHVHGSAGDDESSPATRCGACAPGGRLAVLPPLVSIASVHTVQSLFVGAVTVPSVLLASDATSRAPPTLL